MFQSPHDLSPRAALPRAIPLATITWSDRAGSPAVYIGPASLEIGDEEVYRDARVETRIRARAGMSGHGSVTACVG